MNKEYKELESKLVEILMSDIDNTDFDDINYYISEGLVSGVRSTIELGDVDEDEYMYYKKLKGGVRYNESVYSIANAYVKLVDMGDYSLYNMDEYKPLTLAELQLIYDYTKWRACDSLETERREYDQDIESLNDDYDFVHFRIVADKNGCATLEEI